jgi:hypothetical protein
VGYIFKKENWSILKESLSKIKPTATETVFLEIFL